jgi:hypothetical protein
MLPLTIFLAKLWGLTCICVAMALALKKEDALGIVDGFLRDSPLRFLASIVALGVGLAMVIGHNVWTGGALPVAVTLLGWTSLLKGLAFLFLPPQRTRQIYVGLGYEKRFIFYMAATLALGLFLTIAAFLG